MMGIEEVKTYLPHREPILMLDRVLWVRDDPVSIQAEKDVRADSPFLKGHFPGRPILPGVLMIEALAQAGLLCLMCLKMADPSWLFYFAGVDNVKFRRMVVPGDCLCLEVKLLRGRRTFWKMEGVARVGDEVAAQGKMSVMFRSEPEGTS